MDTVALDREAFAARIDQLLSVYAAAMHAPSGELYGRRLIMAGHSSQPGFAALAAMDGEEVAGFCYGFHGRPGQWWHDRVSAGLGDGRRTWLGDCLELAELHVRPEYQGRGIGSGLLRSLTTSRPEQTVVLSTGDSETVARRMYRGAGFTDLLTGFRFDGVEPPYAIMGATLPLKPSP
jgi:ribosomal protein S18 acetylase RimI-like enzyme